MENGANDEEASNENTSSDQNDVDSRGEENRDLEEPIDDGFPILDYVVDKSKFPSTVQVKTANKFDVGGIIVRRGRKAKLRVLLPRGINILQWEPFSNSFQYGVRIGDSAESTQGTSGSMVKLYDNREGKIDEGKPAEGSRYIYVDNTNSSKDFVAAESSKLRIYMLEETLKYIDWCNGECGNL